MTDNETIKALECCCKNNNCEGCPLDYLTFSSQCVSELAIKSLDLINRLQAQNKYLAETIHNLTIEKDALFDKAEELNVEIERLKECPKCVYEYDGEITEYCVQGPCSNFKTVEQVKDEAYKECLAKVKNYIKTHCNPYGKPDFDYDTSIKILNFIDNLVKEIIGE